MKPDAVTCSFPVDRTVYKACKNIVLTQGESVDENYCTSIALTSVPEILHKKTLETLRKASDVFTVIIKAQPYCRLSK